MTTLKVYLSNKVKGELLNITNGKKQYGALMHAANSLPSLREFITSQLMDSIMYDAPLPKLEHEGNPITLESVFENPEPFDEMYNLIIVQSVDSLFSNPLKK
ncbi:hypothetical protein PM21P2_00022 [Parabacteroides phage PM21P2]|nr:hypothetical protein PM21P2_00022 [Parabacteroides phage PM21P2]